MTRQDHPNDGDYLWDRSGPVDPEVARLEQALGELRFDGELDERALDRACPPASRAMARQRDRRRRWRIGVVALAAAAAVALFFAASGGSRSTEPTAARPLAVPSFALPAPIASSAPTAVGWKVATLTGAPAWDAAANQGRLRVGEWLVTDERSSAQVEVADIGSMEIAPGSELRLVDTGERGHRAELRRGRLSAVISAPPRIFVVQTPTARAVDLGCRYSLEVQKDGSSILEVTTGWVALEGQRETVYVSAGTRSRTKGTGEVGLPRAVDATATFVAALDRLESGERESLPDLIARSRPGDRATLWHVLARESTGESRKKLYERIVALGSARAPARRAKEIESGDNRALEQWGRDIDLLPPSTADATCQPPNCQ